MEKSTFDESRKFFKKMEKLFQANNFKSLNVKFSTLCAQISTEFSGSQILTDLQNTDLKFNPWKLLAPNTQLLKDIISWLNLFFKILTSYNGL